MRGRFPFSIKKRQTADTGTNSQLSKANGITDTFSLSGEIPPEEHRRALSIRTVLIAVRLLYFWASLIPSIVDPRGTVRGRLQSKLVKKPAEPLD
jgi:hypothetical protein